MAAPPVAAAASPETKAKPEKPDEKAYQASLAAAEKELTTAQKKLEAIRETIQSATPSNQDSPVAKKQQELQTQLNSIRQQQQGFKSTRGALQEKINALDATIKSRMNEQKSQRDKLGFKNVEEIDREIQRLEKQVDSGTMRLVDEKKNLSEISNLRKQRKGFAGFDESKKTIDNLKTQLATLKKGLDNPESKALSEQYTAIRKELDEIKSQQDGVFKNIKSLRDDRTKLQADQQKAWTQVREIKDNYFKNRRAYREYEQEAYRVRQERQKAEREIYEKERKKKVADKKLEEASNPAYTDEILSAEGLIRHFDPSYDLSSLGIEKNGKTQPGSYRAEVGRKIDDSNIKGVRVARKDEREEEYFMAGTGGKKGKKGKKGPSNAASSSGPQDSGKFNLNLGVIEELSKVKVEPPMNQSDVPAVVEKLAAKITEWKKNQESKTAENIKKAQAEIDRLEEEESAADSKAGAAGESNQSTGQDAVTETSEKLKESSLDS